MIRNRLLCKTRQLRRRSLDRRQYSQAMTRIVVPAPYGTMIETPEAGDADWMQSDGTRGTDLLWLTSTGQRGRSHNKEPVPLAPQELLHHGISPTSGFLSDTTVPWWYTTSRQGTDVVRRFCQKFYETYEKRRWLTIAGDDYGPRGEPSQSSIVIVARNRQPRGTRAKRRRR